MALQRILRSFQASSQAEHHKIDCLPGFCVLFEWYLVGVQPANYRSESLTCDGGSTARIFREQ
eukprot:3311953-Pleurochrysis_carterae.AAC.4